MKSKVLLASHVYYTSSGPVHGPVNVLEDYLVHKKINYLSVKYPLTSGWPIVLKSFFEISATLFRILMHRPDIFIGIDPLNAFAGVVFRKIGLLKKTVFYCVDYTPTRFTNKIVNSVYLWIDNFCAKNSDEVWNVSTRIVDLRKKQGVANEKIKFVPNSPVFGNCPRRKIADVDRNRIVMVSGLTHGPALDLVLESFKKVHSKFPKTKLVIVGTGSYQRRLTRRIKTMGLVESVILAGQLPNSELLTEVSKSALALSIYPRSKNYSWVYYGDSKKTREYLACGVPVITTDVVSTCDDIKKYNAGTVIGLNENELVDAVEKFLADKNFWLTARKNSLKLAKRFDIGRILDKTLLPLL